MLTCYMSTQIVNPGAQNVTMPFKGSGQIYTANSRKSIYVAKSGRNYS